MGVPHVPLNFRPGNQGGHGVHHNHVQGPRAHQGLTDLQALLSRVRLGNQHIINVHPQGPGIGGVQSVLRVDEGHLAPPLLGLCRDVQGQGGFAGGFRPIDLNDPPPGNPADAQRQVQGHRAGGNALHHHPGVGAQAHDGPLAIGLFNLRHGGFQCLLLVRGRGRRLHHFLFLCHCYTSSSMVSWSISGISRSLGRWPSTTRSIPPVSRVMRMFS